MNKKIIILIIVAMLVVFAISFVIAKTIIEKENVNVVNTNTSTSTNTNTQKQNVDNRQNIVNNVVNTTIENVTEQNNETKENNTTTTENTETFNGDVQTEEQKAINIVRRDYGNNGSNTKISVDGIAANGSYIIVVRDSSTTEALAYYTVNAQTGEFTKKEVF